MRLKCIKLAGFKSFVDPTTINFPSNLCAIVGPNGCGKSNIIDAVRWVMGESSARNLRGEQMSDVIFNGSSARKPVGLASVELIFDNHDHKLAGEYANFSEVSIRRRVDRDGVSVYTLNGARCRRRDITDVFLGTGLGARSYSIIEQGMISRLIESRPDELRAYIEEAAGISRYRERRRETESRMRRTRENMDRLADIREELDRQLQHLKRQSVAAGKYEQLKQQQRQTRAHLNALRWRGLDADIKAGEAATADLRTQIESVTADQRTLDAQVEQQLVDNAGLTDALGEVQERYYGWGNQIARIEQSIKHHLDQVEQMKLDLGETEQGWIQTRRELDADLRKITELTSTLESVSPQLEAATAKGDKSRGLLAEAEQALRRWQQDWDRFNRRAEQPRQTAEVEQSRIQQLQVVVQAALERKQRLEQELAKLVDEPADAAAPAEKIATQEQALDTMQKEMAELTRRRSRESRAHSEVVEQLDAQLGELRTARGRFAALEALQRAALGQDNKELMHWLQEQGLADGERLAQKLRIEPGWERAVEVALGAFLQGVCVAGADTLDGLLTATPPGQLALLDLSAAAAEQAAGSERGLTALATKTGAQREVAMLLPGVYGAETLEDALALRERLQAGESLITPEGVWLGPGWLRLPSGDASDPVLKRQDLMDDLSIKIKELTDKSKKLQEEKEALGSSLEEGERSREELLSKIGAATRELGDIKSSRSALLVRIEEADLRRGRLQQELEDLAVELATAEENRGVAQARLQQALGNVEQDADRRRELEAGREQAQQTLEQRREQVRGEQELVHELALQQQTLQARLQSTREAMDRMASQVQRSRERMESLSGQIRESDRPIQAMRKELESLLQRRLEVDGELSTARRQVEESQHRIRTLEQSRNACQQQLDALRGTLTEKLLRSEGASVKRAALLEELRKEGFEPEQVLAELPEKLDEQGCEQRLEKLVNRIARLGPINLAAVDEYRRESERKVYLDRQHEDLDKALDTLQNAIRRIDRETRTRFKETFDQLNAGLKDLFPRLFGGGHAYLDMTGEDLLDTGVAIMARPPGKRNSTIHLLSGGEKAMTAIALVFSIFHLNPSPLCLLDEVDAPLDDTNVSRYTNLVGEWAANVQFIFITHNKITMEMAKQLLGVTTQEPGVSRMVAVDIDEAAELAAL